MAGLQYIQNKQRNDDPFLNVKFNRRPTSANEIKVETSRLMEISNATSDIKWCEELDSGGIGLNIFAEPTRGDMTYLIKYHWKEK